MTSQHAHTASGGIAPHGQCYEAQIDSFAFKHSLGLTHGVNELV